MSTAYKLKPNTDAPSMGPSLHARFLKETLGIDCLEYEWGYATYQLEPDHVYIIDIYVLPELRSAGKGVQLMHEIGDFAASKGAKWMYGSVAKGSALEEANLKMLKHLGFVESHEDQNLTYLKRSL